MCYNINKDKRKDVFVQHLLRFIDELQLLDDTFNNCFRTTLVEVYLCSFLISSKMQSVFVQHLLRFIRITHKRRNKGKIVFVQHLLRFILYLPRVISIYNNVFVQHLLRFIKRNTFKKEIYSSFSYNTC